jgi:hypothetical protein
MPSNFVARGPEAYDSYMGRWNKRLASGFLEFAGLVEGGAVLDVGCGTALRGELAWGRKETQSASVVTAEAGAPGVSVTWSSRLAARSRRLSQWANHLR